jgi:hypothetical protein
MRWLLLFALLASMLMALPAGAQPATSNVYVFPLFADGSNGTTSYRSTLKISKTSTANSMQCSLVQRNTAAPFVGVDGTVYDADVIDAGFSPPALTPITLDQYLPFEILRTNAQSTLKTGYAKITCPGTLDTQLQFSLSDAKNNKLGEATIRPATKGNSFQFLIDKRDGTSLGFSLVNDSASGGQYALIARDRFNFEIDRAYDNIDPWSQVSKFVDQMLQLPSDFVGSIEVVGLTGGQNYAVGLQFTGTVFTTIEPLVRATPLPN